MLTHPLQRQSFGDPLREIEKLVKRSCAMSDHPPSAAGGRGVLVFAIVLCQFNNSSIRFATQPRFNFHLNSYRLLNFSVPFTAATVNHPHASTESCITPLSTRQT